MEKTSLILLGKTHFSVSSRHNPEPVQSAPENESTHQPPTKASLLVKTFLRWTEPNEPLGPFQAMVRILFASALYQTHDPIRLQHLTGLPLSFLSETVTILLGSSLWLGPEGLVMLSSDLDEVPEDEERIDGLLGELVSQIFSLDHYRTLCELWSESNPTSSAL